MDKNTLASLMIVALVVAMGLMFNPNIAQAGEINACMRLVRTRDMTAIDAASHDEEQLLLLREEVRWDIELCMVAAGLKTDLLQKVYWRTIEDGGNWRIRRSERRYDSMIACNWEILAFKNMVNNSFFLGGLPTSGRNVCRGQ